MMNLHDDDLCPWCGELVSPDERAYDYERGTRAHIECAIRLIFGSLGHLERRYSYRVGTRDEDPPGMSRREAALAAYGFLKATFTAPLRN